MELLGRYLDFLHYIVKKTEVRFVLEETDREIDRGEVLTPRKDFKIDRDDVLGTDLRFLQKSRKTGQTEEKTGKNQEKYSKNGTVGQLFYFPK